MTRDAKHFDFIHFPGFAKFILDNHLREYSLEQIKISRQIDVPLLKVFSGLSDDQLLEIITPSHTNFLTHVHENRLQEEIDESMQKWQSDDLQIIGKNQISAEDITLASYVRKRAMLKFVNEYTSDPYELVQLISEIEYYETVATTASANMYIDILKERINEHTLFIENINNTTPGLNYVFDIAENKLVYANKNFEEYLGYNKDEMSKLGQDVFTQLAHPDDLAHATTTFKRFLNAEDGQVISWEQRLKYFDGEYKWVRTHASVFKRDSNGIPVEIAGIALDVDIEKRTAEELLKSEERLLEAQELADMASYEMDVETEELSVSPNFLKIAGLPPGFKRPEFLKNIHPGDKRMVHEAMKKAVEELGVYDSEYRYNRDGEQRILWSRGKVDTKDGKPVLRGTLMDVTERRHMIQQLQWSENLYRQAQALANVGNWTWFIATNRLTWSDELYRIFGVEDHSQPITYEQYLSFIHPEDKMMLLAAFEKALADKQPYDLIHRIILQNGTTKVIHSKGEVIIGENNEPIKLLGTGQDITRSYYTAQELREKQEFIQKVANTTPSIIASYNIHTGKYTYVNNAIFNILGHDVSEVLDKGIAFFMEIIHPDDVGDLFEKNALALEEANSRVPDDGNEPITEFKYRLRHKNGEYRWFDTYGTIFDRNDEGKVEHLLNVSVDITEQEEAQQALHQKNILLQQSNASLEEYAYVASHDLKEPLRKISTFGDRLLSTQYDQLDNSGKAFIDKIIDSSRRMQTMINDLLSISIISGNKIFVTSDLNEILDDVLATLEYKIEEKEATVKAEKLPTANIVVSQFRHLFQNLISNSLKFSRDGVRPEITVSCEYLQPAKVKAPDIAIAKQYLSIRFSDNGIGFDSQYANKIFTIFQRLHSKTDYEGNGIGLAICKKIAENHGGTISATGIPNEGSTFTVIIPA